jgi:peptidyl-prolyl cis-trans isomerase C
MGSPMITWGGLLLLAATFAWGVGCSKSTPGDDIVAIVGKHEIRTAEFQAWMRRRGVGDSMVQKEALLEEMVNHHAAVQRAMALGLDRDPQLQLAWENQLVNSLRKREVETGLSNAVPTAEQVQAAYEAQRASHSEPAMRRGAILFRELGPKATDTRRDEARKRIGEARTKALEAAADPTQVRGFGALAVEYSEDPVTRYKGGDLGWIIEGRSDHRFDDAVLKGLFALKATNEVSEVIETPAGLYVVKLLEVRPGRVKPLDSVRGAIAHALQVEQRRAFESNWSAGLRTDLRIERRTNVLARIMPPTRPATTPSPSDEPPVIR